MSHAYTVQSKVILLMSFRKVYGRPRPDFTEAHKFSSALMEDLIYRIPLKSNNNYGMYL